MMLGFFDTGRGLTIYLFILKEKFDDTVAYDPEPNLGHSKTIRPGTMIIN